MQRSVKIDYDLESTSLEIKTDSELERGDKVGLKLYNAQGENAGGIKIYLQATSQFRIRSCQEDRFNFPKDNVPSAKDKVWRVTVTKSSNVRLVIHCNDVEVLNTVLSPSNCQGYKDDWSRRWNRDVAQILFDSEDTASDFYRPRLGGYKLSLSMLELV